MLINIIYMLNLLLIIFSFLVLVLLLLFFFKFIWQIFTGIFPRHYDPPDGFVFEINDISPPIQVIAKEMQIMLLYFYSKSHFHVIFLIEG